MPEEQKPVGEEVPKEKPPEQKDVPFSDFLAFKNASTGREKKLKTELEEAQRKVTDYEVELEMARRTEGGDTEVEEVKKYLLEEKKKVAGLEAKWTKEGAALIQRERAVRAKELAVEYKINPDDLHGDGDIEAIALRLYAERLAKENEDLKKKSSSSGSIYESTPGGTSKKMPRDMTPAEFKAYEKRELAKTMAKR